MRGGNDIQSITKRLDVVISLLALFVTKDTDMTLRDKIIMLDSFGLRPAEVASILGKTSSHVSKELSLARSKK